MGTQIAMRNPLADAVEIRPGPRGHERLVGQFARDFFPGEPEDALCGGIPVSDAVIHIIHHAPDGAAVEHHLEQGEQRVAVLKKLLPRRLRQLVLSDLSLQALVGFFELGRAFMHAHF